jgi:hypothetical protein
VVASQQAFGSLDRESLRFLDGLARHGGAPRRQLKPGTVLVRDYQGQRHTVTVAANGFNWQGTTLSEPLRHRPRHHRHCLERSPVLHPGARQRQAVCARPSSQEGAGRPQSPRDRIEHYCGWGFL